MKKSLLATLAVAALALTSLSALAQKDPDVGGAASIQVIDDVLMPN